MPGCRDRGRKSERFLDDAPAEIDKFSVDGAKFAIAIDQATRASYTKETAPVRLTRDVDVIVDA